MQRYFIDQPIQIGQTITLPSDIQKHWVKVLRANDGDRAEFVGNDQTVYLGILRINSEAPQVVFTKQLDMNVELPYHVTIACGLPKKDKADLITMKATELGVDQIIFFPSDWAIAKWNDNRVDKKLARLQEIAKNAAQQSHRNQFPHVTYKASLKTVLEEAFDHKVVAYEEAAKRGETSAFKKVIDQMHPGQSLLAIFGPEGGISPAEIKQMNQHAVQTIGLGPRILRTETAPLYLLSAISAFCELS